jgi:hypothetical protein
MIAWLAVTADRQPALYDTIDARPTYVPVRADTRQPHARSTPAWHIVVDPDQQVFSAAETILELSESLGPLVWMLADPKAQTGRIGRFHQGKQVWMLTLAEGSFTADGDVPDELFGPIQAHPAVSDDPVAVLVEVAGTFVDLHPDAERRGLDIG